MVIFVQIQICVHWSSIMSNQSHRLVIATVMVKFMHKVGSGWLKLTPVLFLSNTSLGSNTCLPNIKKINPLIHSWATHYIKFYSISLLWDDVRPYNPYQRIYIFAKRYSIKIIVNILMENRTETVWCISFQLWCRHKNDAKCVLYKIYYYTKIQE